jgi:hypothetical protein
MKWILFLCIELFCFSAYAQRTANIATIEGLSSCGEYLDARKKNEIGANIIRAWVLGYLSGYNLYSNQPRISIPDGPTIFAYFDKYCVENPLQYITTGAGQLIGELDGYKPQYFKKP